MAVAFENCDVVLSEERAQHINERHVRLDINTRASKFKQNFHLVSCLARLTKMTWKERSVLSEERAQHINERHMRLDINTRASKFKQNFHLVSCLARLTKMTWKERSDYEIIAQGFKQGHGHYYIYVFTLPKVIRYGPLGVSVQENLYIFFLAALEGSKISYSFRISVFREL